MTAGVIITCEHASNAVPVCYQDVFEHNEAVLQTHRGYDMGALNVAIALSQTFNCSLIQAKITRLLIDCNRTQTHSQCFSEFSKPLSLVEKQRLIEQYYLPYRQTVEETIHSLLKTHTRVVHLSIHSFTPVLNEMVRTTDIGLLYDPKRQAEKILAMDWKQALNHYFPTYRVRMNYPYRGTSDGFTSYLRKQLPADTYVGLELEMNQALTTDNKTLQHLSYAVTQAVSCALGT